MYDANVCVCFSMMKNKAAWMKFLKRFEDAERWRTGADDRPMKDVIPDMEKYHNDMRIVAEIVRKSIGLIPTAMGECANCKPNVPCGDGCLAEAFLNIFGLHGKPRGKPNGKNKKGKK